jgi:hypothetical protein
VAAIILFSDLFPLFYIILRPLVINVYNIRAPPHLSSHQANGDVESLKLKSNVK